jgi:hypothetical protein
MFCLLNLPLLPAAAASGSVRASPQKNVKQSESTTVKLSPRERIRERVAAASRSDGGSSPQKNVKQPTGVKKLSPRELKKERAAAAAEARLPRITSPKKSSSKVSSSSASRTNPVARAASPARILYVSRLKYLLESLCKSNANGHQTTTPTIIHS